MQVSHLITTNFVKESSKLSWQTHLITNNFIVSWGILLRNYQYHQFNNDIPIPTIVIP